MNQYASTKDFEKKALSVMSENAINYINSGANHELCLRENESKLGLVKLNPRVLRDVSKIDTTATLLGQKLSLPFGIAPSGMHCFVHPEGELNTIRAAAACDTVMTVSSAATKSLQDVAKASPASYRWFQLYVTKNREISKRLIRQAEENGYKALVVTVDAPVLGKREAIRRKKLVLPPGTRLENMEAVADLLRTEDSGDKGVLQLFGEQIRKDLNWEDLRWLQQQTKLPIILKGIQGAEDARLCGEKIFNF